LFRDRELRAPPVHIEREEEKKDRSTHVVDVHVLGGSRLSVSRVGRDPELVSSVDLDVGIVSHESSSDLGSLLLKSKEEKGVREPR